MVSDKLGISAAALIARATTTKGKLGVETEKIAKRISAITDSNESSCAAENLAKLNMSNVTKYHDHTHNDE